MKEIDSSHPIDRVTKKHVGYKAGSRKEHCSLCKHFIPPIINQSGQCWVVEGHIATQAWCRMFRD